MEDGSFFSNGNGNVNGNNNGMRSMYLFPGGYCNLNDPTVTNTGDPGTDSISYHYYNKDHLGNNREVISESGTIEQVVHYYPFGTPFTDGSSTNIGLQPYLYGNKELDMMHGLNTYDFGARNYNPLLPMWDRVDPKAGDYPWLSPYTYCMNNPMRIIDPVGMDIWELDKNGYIVNHKETDVADVFYFREDHWGGKGLLVLDFGTVEDNWPGKTNEGNVYQAYKIRGDENGQKLFEFMADHTGVEWSHYQLDEEGKNGLNYVSSDFNSSSDGSGTYMFNEFISNGQHVLRVHSHNHPSGVLAPSDNEKLNTGDIPNAKSVDTHVKQFQTNSPIHKIYSAISNQYIVFDGFSKISDFPINVNLGELIVKPERK